MPTFKPVIIKSDERKDGTYLIKIRIIHKRQIRYIRTPFYVNKKEVTRKGVIKDMYLLDKLHEMCSELRRKSVELGFKIDNMSIDDLRYFLTSKEVSDLDITDFCNKFCDDLIRDNRSGTAMCYRTAMKSLQNYLKKDKIFVSEIKKKVVNDFIEYLLSINKKITVKNTISLLSTLFNSAIKKFNDEDSGIIIVPYNPFKDVINFNISEEKKNAFPTVEYMQKFIDNKTKCQYEKDMFIFSFCTLGMNMADILRLEKCNYDKNSNIIRYKRKKIERRCGCESVMEVKLNDVSKKILERYIDTTDSKLLFKLPKKSCSLKYNKIEEELGFSHFTFYTARHTMATFARNICNIDKYVVHEMLNHASDSRMRITDAYIDKSYTHLWEANEKLMSLFDWSIYLSEF